MIVTSELLSLSLRLLSAMSIVAVGLSVSIATVSLAPVAPTLSARSVYTPVTVTEPLVSTPSVAVNVAVQVTPPSLLVSA